MDNNFDTDVLQICRTCMKEITDGSFFYLDFIPAANSQITIRQLLYSCIPVLDLRIVLDPVICSKCVDNLLSVFEFKNNCLQSEIQINQYIQQVQHTGDLNLLDVLQFHQPDIKNFDIEVKIEDLESTEDFKNEDLVSGTSAFEASECTESTEQKYFLELQKVETEDVLFNTFDDYNINYNLSAAKENSDTHNSNIELQDNYSKNLNNTNVYQCYKCGHKVENKLKFISHVKHRTQKNLIHRKRISKILSEYHKNLFDYYKCSVCNYLTKYKSLFDFHNQIHLTKKNYKQIFKQTVIHTKALHTTIKVNKTNFITNKRNRIKNCNSLKRNMKAHIMEKLFKCSICKYQCNFKVNLKQHMQMHTGEKPFSCSVCEYRCSQKTSLKKHMKIHMGEKPFSCSVCEYQCSQQSNLKSHMVIHTGEKPFSCSVCEYRCSHKTSLKQHMRSHTGEKPFSCSICEYQCSQKSALKEHIRIHTGEKPFSCSVCEYQCSRKNNLKEHMQIHTGEKPFSCSVCEYQCSQKSSLKRHILIHTGEKPFSCSICEYQCSQKSALKEHIRIHTGEKPFSCSVCEYQCSRKNNLKEHMQIHTGEKPFSCSVCEYQCSQKSSLKRHIRIHTGEKPFSCSFCEFRCSDKTNKAPYYANPY